MSMECEVCGEELFRVKGLCLDRDGMREAAYCFDCHILYKVAAHGLIIIRKPLPEGNCKHQMKCCFHEKEEGMVLEKERKLTSEEKVFSYLGGLAIDGELPNLIDVVAYSNGWNPLVVDEKMTVCSGDKTYNITRVK